VPTQLPPNCEIGAVLRREDPRDAFVLKAGRQKSSLADLPPGSVVGTSSIRRTAQIALQYPHLRIQDMRGNVGTRLRKLDAEDSTFDAIILAAAGLIRLDLSSRISHFLDSSDGNMLYAVGQGAIGIENRSDDVKVKETLRRVNHMPTFLAITCERSLLRILEGGCSAPLGVETRWVKGRGDKDSNSVLMMKAIVVSVDGTSSAEVEMEEKVESVEQAEAFGVRVATQLCTKGADKILAEVSQNPYRLRDGRVVLTMLQIKAKKPTTVIDLEQT
jgi:hydroxymethylbilane synthase